MRKPVLCLAAGAAVLLLMAGCNRSPQQREAKYLKRGEARLKNKDYGRALLEFKNASQAMPKDAEPYYQAGLTYLAAGSARQAASAFLKAVSLNPKHERADLKLAEILVASRQEDLVKQGAERLRKLIAANPNNLEAVRALAAAEVEMGQKDAAEAQLASAAEHFPERPDLALDLAAVKFAEQDREGAEAELQRALRLDPKDPSALWAKTRMDLAAHKFDEAGQNLRKLAGIDEDTYGPRYAAFLFSQGKKDEAIRELQQAAKRYPSDRSIRDYLIAGYLATNQRAQAEQVLDSALKKNPRDSEALLRRAQLYIQSGKTREAQADLASVLHFQPNSAQAHFEMAAVYRAESLPKNEDQELNEVLRIDPAALPARLMLSRNILRAHAPQSALSLLMQAPAAQQKTLEFLIERNWALLAAGEQDEARTALAWELKHARVPELVLQEALLYLEEHKYVQARQDASEVLQKEPQEIRAAQVIAQTYVAQGNAKEGLRQLEQWAAPQTHSAAVQYFLANWELSAGNRTRAREAFEAALAANPKLTDAGMALANLDLDDKQTGAAKQRLAAILAANPRNIPALVMLGYIEGISGDRQGAMAQFRAVLVIDPSNTMALNNLAYYVGQDDPDAALTLAQQALEQAPGNPAVEDTMGWIYYRRHQYQDAIEHLKAADKDGSPRHEFHLAMAYLKAGDQQLGYSTLNAALKKEPDLLKTEQGW
jgi:tetratricopeptide (TPR) repeat protein